MYGEKITVNNRDGLLKGLDHHHSNPIPLVPSTVKKGMSLRFVSFWGQSPPPCRFYPPPLITTARLKTVMALKLSTISRVHEMLLQHKEQHNN